MSRIPAEEELSLTYCKCSKGFVEKLWEAIQENPVEAVLLQSTMSRAEECKFGIRF